jgi:rhodanese-related sulfurtransferase
VVPETIDAASARAAALKGELLLVDIRAPAEWEQTGIADVAHPLDMTRPDFLEAFEELHARHLNREVAIMCRSGARSARVRAALEAAGHEVSDLSEGILGWLARGLPVRRPGEDPVGA